MEDGNLGMMATKNFLRDVLLKQDGNTGFDIVDELNKNSTKIGSYGSESMHGVKATYARESKAYRNSERKWDSMVGHSRYTNDGNFEYR